MTSTMGSIGWLFRHELKLRWRSFGRRRVTSLGVGGALAAWQLISLVLVFGAERADLPALEPPLPFAAVSAGALFLFLGMVSTALDAAIQAIYVRGDMDLLASSPFPRHVIMLVRMTAIASSVCIGGAILALPLANACAVLGHPAWLVAYITIPCLGLLATTGGLLLAILLFRLLGARTTRLVAQILSATLGITFALTAQIPNLRWVSESTDVTGLGELARYLPGPASWLWWPARGAMGEVWPMIGLILVSLGCFIAAALILADRFVTSAIEAASIGGNATRNRDTAPRAFRTEPLAELRRKELRLLIRDPWLLTQLARQLVLLLPFTLIVWRAEAGGNSGRWLVLIMTAGYMAGEMTWLTLAGEDAPDLLASAPLRPAEILRAKLQAALVPVALFMAVPLLVASYFSLWLSLCLVVCGAGNALYCAMRVYLYRAPTKHDRFVRRGAANTARSLLHMAIGGLWMCAGFFMMKHSLWAVLPAAIAALPLYRLLRRSARSI